MVSEWRSVIAMSLNIGGGVRLIKAANCTCARKTLQTQRGRTHGAGCVRQWFRTAELLGERRYKNWNTYIPFWCPKVLFGPFRWLKYFSVFSRTVVPQYLSLMTVRFWTIYLYMAISLCKRVRKYVSIVTVRICSNYLLP